MDSQLLQESDLEKMKEVSDPMETKTRKAEVAHKIIETGENLLNVVWSKADERRAASLEIIARTAYTAEESACHYLETIGLDRKGNIRETLELARYQDTN